MGISLTLALLAGFAPMARASTTRTPVPVVPGAQVVVDPLNQHAITKGCQGADVVVIGARGSNERLDEGLYTDQKVASLYGLGKPVSYAADELRKQFTNATKIRFMDLPYGAVEADNAFWQRNFYAQSVYGGVHVAAGYVRALNEKCPSAKIVLIGYSQRAQVMHNLVAPPATIPAAHRLTAAQLKSIAAVELIADPIRNGSDSATRYWLANGQPTTWSSTLSYTGQKNVAVFKQKGALAQGVPVPMPAMNFPTEFNGRVLNFCQPFDLICNGAPVAGSGTHGTAYHNAAAHAGPSKWIGARVMESLRAARGTWPPAPAAGPVGGTVVTDGTADNISKKCEATVAVIGARDSMETATSGSIRGLGDTVSAAAAELVSQLPRGTKARYIPVQHPGTDTPTPFGITPQYFASLSGAKKRGTQLITQLLTSCPSTKIALIGYGQGAEVWHEVVATLTSAQRNQVRAMWLIGDHTRNGTDAAPTSLADTSSGAIFEYSGGSTFAAKGVLEGTRGCAWAGTICGELLPVDLRGRVVNSCVVADIYCNHVKVSSGAHYSAGVMAHASAYKDLAATRLPAAYLANQLAAKVS